jgi:DNA-binding transcriptional regulator YiaG
MSTSIEHLARIPLRPPYPNCIVNPMTGKELRAVRKRLRLTQSALAAQLGVHWNTVARWERDEVGISEPAARLLRILAEQQPPRRREK